jgi:hypothetical protein
VDGGNATLPVTNPQMDKEIGDWIAALSVLPTDEDRRRAVSTVSQTHSLSTDFSKMTTTQN